MKGMFTYIGSERWEILTEPIASEWDGESTIEVGARRLSDYEFNLIKVGDIGKIYKDGDFKNEQNS